MMSLGVVAQKEAFVSAVASNTEATQTFDPDKFRIVQTKRMLRDKQSAATSF